MIKSYEYIEDKKQLFYLRPFTKEDITYQYLSWFHDQEVTKHTSHGLFKYTKEQAIEFLEGADKNGDVIWVIITEGEQKCSLPGLPKEFYKNEKHIGNIALQNINWINRTAEFAGIIGEKEYWNKGFGTKAIRILFNHGFNKLNLNRIWLGTAANNEGMIKIAKKLGMKQEGCLKDHIYLNGFYEDVIKYGILKSEWNKQ